MAGEALDRRRKPRERRPGQDEAPWWVVLTCSQLEEVCWRRACEPEKSWRRRSLGTVAAGVKKAGRRVTKATQCRGTAQERRSRGGGTSWGTGSLEVEAEAEAEVKQGIARRGEARLGKVRSKVR